MYRYLPGAGTDTGIYIGAFVRHLHLPADGSGDNVHRRRGTDGELLPQDDIAGLTRVLAASLVAATLVICARRVCIVPRRPFMCYVRCYPVPGNWLICGACCVRLAVRAEVRREVVWAG